MRSLVALLWLSLLCWRVGAQADFPLGQTLLALNIAPQDAIVLYDIDSETYRRLSLGDGVHHVWDFAPDGCQLLLTYDGGLYSMALDGSDLHEMAAYPDLARDQWAIWHADWSPDGTRIAFTLRRQQAEQVNYHIAYVLADDPAIQFYSVSGREFAPTWSPDGQWLAYLAYQERIAGATLLATAPPTAEPAPNHTPIPSVTRSEADLWLVDADGSLKYQLTDFSTGSVSQARWSPDGQLLSFVWSPQPNSDMLWMIAKQPGSVPTQLSYEWSMVLDHTWQADATALIASLRDFRETLPNRLWRVPLVNQDDSLTNPAYSDAALAYADFPRFSPDGRWLAVRDAYQMIVIDLDNGTRRALDTAWVGNSAAVWSPSAFRGEASCP